MSTKPQHPAKAVAPSFVIRKKIFTGLTKERKTPLMFITVLWGAFLLVSCLAYVLQELLHIVGSPWWQLISGISVIVLISLLWRKTQIIMLAVFIVVEAIFGLCLIVSILFQWYYLITLSLVFMVCSLFNMFLFSELFKKKEVS